MRPELKTTRLLENSRGSRCRRQWGTKSPEGVDPASRRRGQGNLQVPAGGCLRPAPLGGKWALFENWGDAGWDTQVDA